VPDGRQPIPPSITFNSVHPDDCEEIMSMAEQLPKMRPGERAYYRFRVLRADCRYVACRLQVTPEAVAHDGTVLVVRLIVTPAEPTFMRH
jgi:hypothetical protein